MKLAKIRHRVMACLLDLAIVIAFFIIIVLAKLPFIVSMFNNSEHTVTTKFIIDVFRWGVIYTVLLFAYYAIIPLLVNGQTIGKKVFKLQIVKEDGSKVDYRTMFYREAAGRLFINFASLGITAFVSMIIMSLRDDKRGIADILAKTKVIDLYESEEE